MAAIWKGAISFGLVNVPVKLLAATDKQSVAFRTLHKVCGNPINQKRFCAVCGTDVEYKDTEKGYEYEKGEFVFITDEDLKKMPLKSAKYIQILSFIDLTEVDPVYFEKSYFLSPEKGGEKPYVLLYEAMKGSNRAAVSKISIREKERLCLVRVYEDILMLNTMFFPIEIRSSATAGDFKRTAETVSEQEQKLAIQIVDNLTTSFSPQDYHDEYFEKLMEIVESKKDGETITLKDKEAPVPKATLDLFERLKQSVEATMGQ